MSKLVWVSGREGGRATVGALLRWREVRRGPWKYGYYRGPEGSMLTFSLTSDGPITEWRVNVGFDAQVAVIVRASPNEGNQGG